MDRGPWRLFYGNSRPLTGGGVAKLEGVGSDDFRADVLLRVSGDFASPADKENYCRWLCDVLNKASAHPETVTGESTL